MSEKERLTSLLDLLPSSKMRGQTTENIISGSTTALSGSKRKNDTEQTKSVVASNVPSKLKATNSNSVDDGEIKSETINLKTKLQVLSSFLSFTVLDRSLKSFMRSNSFCKKYIPLPPPLVGMFCLFLLLLGTSGKAIAVNGGKDVAKENQSPLYHFLKPGSDILTMWLAVFFVPSLIMLPVALKSVPTLALGRLALLSVMGFSFTIISTLCFTNKLLQAFNTSSSNNDRVSSTPASTSVTPPSAKTAFISTLAPTSPGVKNVLSRCSILFAFLSVASSRLSLSAAPMITKISFLGFTLTTTLLGFVQGQLFPSKVKKIFHPLLTCMAYSLTSFSLYRVLHNKAIVGTSTESLSTIFDVLKKYVTGNKVTILPMDSFLSSLQGLGGGDILLGLLGPSIWCLSIQMYERRQLINQHKFTIFLSTIIASFGGLFSSAFLSRFLLNHPSIPPAIRLAPLSRCITTPLAMSVASSLNADVSIAVMLVVVTGLIGANIGQSLMSSLKSNGGEEAIPRGIAMGSAAHGLGTAALSTGEKDSQPLAFSAISMALTGIFTTILSSIPPIKKMLLKIVLC